MPMHDIDETEFNALTDRLKADFFTAVGNGNVNKAAMAIQSFVSAYDEQARPKSPQNVTQMNLNESERGQIRASGLNVAFGYALNIIVKEITQCSLPTPEEEVDEHFQERVDAIMRSAIGSKKYVDTAYHAVRQAAQNYGIHLR